VNATNSLGCGIVVPLLIVALPAFAQSSADKKNLPGDLPATVVERTEDITVRIICQGGRKTGSGIIIGSAQDNRAIILTARHVVYNEKNTQFSQPETSIVVKLRREQETRKVGIQNIESDPGIDFAVITTDPGGPVDEVVHYTTSDAVGDGSTIAACGYPIGEQPIITLGRIVGTSNDLRFFITDAQVDPGNSGGPMIDADGRLIGIVLQKQEAHSQGFALKLDIAQPTIKEWLKSKPIRREWEYEEARSFAHRMYTDWRYILGEAAIIGTATYLLTRPPNGSTIPDPSRPPGY